MAGKTPIKLRTVASFRYTKTLVLYFHSFHSFLPFQFLLSTPVSASLSTVLWVSKCALVPFLPISLLGFLAVSSQFLGLHSLQPVRLSSAPQFLISCLHLFLLAFFHMFLSPLWPSSSSSVLAQTVQTYALPQSPAQPVSVPFQLPVIVIFLSPVLTKLSVIFFHPSASFRSYSLCI